MDPVTFVIFWTPLIIVLGAVVLGIIFVLFLVVEAIKALYYSFTGNSPPPDKVHPLPDDAIQGNP